MTDGEARRIARGTLALFYAVAGVAHLLATDAMVRITPAWVPFPHAVVIATGLCELAGAAGLMTRRWRVAAGWSLALYAVCVFPANIKHADARSEQRHRAWSRLSRPPPSATAADRLVGLVGVRRHPTGRLPDGLPQGSAFPSCSHMNAPAQLSGQTQDPPYLSGLNPEQRDAVMTTDGPVLVLAGAGTGKTAALTARLAHLLYTRRAWPSEILSVTFTNKAAREMRERVGRLVGDAVEGMPWLGTFHAIGAKMLRRHAELVGLQSNFTILDTDDHCG